MFFLGNHPGVLAATDCNGKDGCPPPPKKNNNNNKKSLLSLVPLNPTLYRHCMDIVQAVESQEVASLNSVAISKS